MRTEYWTIIEIEFPVTGPSCRWCEKRNLNVDLSFYLCVPIPEFIDADASGL